MVCRETVGRSVGRSGGAIRFFAVVRQIAQEQSRAEQRAVEMDEEERG